MVAVSAMGKTWTSSSRWPGRSRRIPTAATTISSSHRGQIAVATLALALQDKGVPAIALTGAQCNIRTDGSFNRARIQSIDTARIVEELGKGKVVIVAGFQGVTANDEVTTLGRGGGDITGAAWPQRSKPRCAKSAPTSTACCWLTRTSCPTRGSGPISATRQRSKWPRARQGAAPARGPYPDALQDSHPHPLDFSHDRGHLDLRRSQ